MLLMALCGMGCFSTKPTAARFYYTISYQPLTIDLPESGRPYPYTVQVNQFAVSRLYNRAQILYRYSHNEIRYYNYRNWAIRPDDMLTAMFVEHLTSAGLFSVVGTRFLDRRPDYYISGEVSALERYDSGDVWYAHLAMTLRLVDAKDGSQIWEYSFDDRRPVLQPEMVYTVNTLSDLMEMHVSRAIRQLDRLCVESSAEGRLVRQAQSAPVPEPVEPDQDPLRARLDEDSYLIVPGKRIPTPADTVGGL